MNTKFNLPSVSIDLSNLIPIGKFIFSSNRVGKNAKWKIYIGDMTYIKLPFTVLQKDHDMFQCALMNAKTDVLMLDVGNGQYKFYTFMHDTIAEIKHPLFSRYVQCESEGISYP